MALGAVVLVITGGEALYADMGHFGKRPIRLLPWLHRTPSSSSLELRELIERLPVRERTVLVLHYGHGYSLGEIGQLLEITHVNARAIISRARRRLVTAWLESES